MKAILGIAMCVGGVALGVYVGIWVCLVGGIVDVINGFGASPFDALGIAWGVVKVLFTGVAGVVSAYLLIIPGVALVASA